MARDTPKLTVTQLSPTNPHPYSSSTPPHHAGSTFCNPWPSVRGAQSPFAAFAARFGPRRNFVPVPENREGLVKIQKPDWGQSYDAAGSKLKATWIGHASWLLETAIQVGSADGATKRQLSVTRSDSMLSGSVSSSTPRGVRILCDPVFSERTSPVTWFGPKRYTPTPCTIEELPHVDMVIISHDHYDHLDSATITQLYQKQQGNLHFLCALRIKALLLSFGAGIREDQITELDWWDSVRVDVAEVGSVRLTCTPAQHFSRRGAFDGNHRLWCSWVLEEDVALDGHSPVAADSNTGERSNGVRTRKLYFAGDTGYRTVESPHPTAEEEASMPHCPAFADIGNVFGPFDLALLPIGLCTPRDFMSPIHCAPEDSICIHKDLKSKKSIGMHYGTVRGGISAYYEDVRYPPQRWKEVCEQAGLKWGVEAGLCDIGESVLID